MQTIISVKKIWTNQEQTSYIEMELIKGIGIIRLFISRDRIDDTFCLTVQSKFRSIYVGTFPKFTEINWKNRSMIKWIGDNADMLINKFINNNFSFFK